MKRIAIVLALVAGGCTPVWSLSALRAYPLVASAGLPACDAAGAFCEFEDSELPWSTVSAVLKKVTEVRDYSYSQLVDWYQVGLVTVEQSGSGYLVTVVDEDGALDALLIDIL